MPSETQRQPRSSPPQLSRKPERISRMPLIDAFKAIAALLVLGNHFSSYGPLADGARLAFPEFTDWLFDYGRMAVQVFLVIAGFLAARGLSRSGEALAVSPLPLLWKRYLRLSIPYLAAIALAIVAAALADRWMDDDAIPARATLGQWLAHALLLQGILGVDALSAGVWYIAIDFQLFALMALLLWAGRIRIVAPALVLAVATASLFWFNRDPELDNWAIYFFGSYGLGAAAWWASERHLPLWLSLLAGVAIAALIVDFRLRIALALAIAITLACSRRSGLLEHWPGIPPLSYLGQISYSIFLVHFPVLLLVNAVYAKLGLSSPATAVFGLLAALTASLLAASGFYRWIESPAASQHIFRQLAWLPGKLRELAGKLPLLGPLFAGRA